MGAIGVRRTPIAGMARSYKRTAPRKSAPWARWAFAGHPIAGMARSYGQRV